MYICIYIYNCTVSPVYLDIEVINKRNCAMCMCKVTRNCAPIAFLYENVAAASLRTKGKDGNTYPPATDVTCHHLNKDTDFGKYYKEYIYICMYIYTYCCITLSMHFMNLCMYLDCSGSARRYGFPWVPQCALSAGRESHPIDR